MNYVMFSFAVIGVAATVIGLIILMNWIYNQTPAGKRDLKERELRMAMKVLWWR